MPQYRKLYTKTTESLDINEMPDDFARLLWLLLPLIVCREGRGMDNPAWIKAKAMSLREDVKQERVETAMRWYAERGMIMRYAVDGRGYFEIVNWARYQGDTRREAESNYPGQDQANGIDCSRPTHDLLVTNSCSDADADANTDADAYTELLTLWAQLFPGKSQPRANNSALRQKFNTRRKDAYFMKNHRAALERAARSTFCNEGPWFDLGWFLKNEEHWENCLNGKYDNKRTNGNGREPTPQFAEAVPEGQYTHPDDEFAIPRKEPQ